MDHKSIKKITAEQIRAARSVLGFSIQKIAETTGIGTATLKRYEVVAGVPESRKGNLETLKIFFESQGIEFIGTPDDRPGIRIGRPKS